MLLCYRFGGLCNDGKGRPEGEEPVHIGLPELLIALAVVIILCGPARVAGVGRALAETLGGLLRALRGRNGRRSNNQGQQ